MKFGGKSDTGIGDELEGREWEIDLIQTYFMHVWVLNKISLKGGLTEECSALNGTSKSHCLLPSLRDQHGRGVGKAVKPTGSRVLLQDNAFQIQEGSCTHELTVAMTSYISPIQH